MAGFMRRQRGRQKIDNKGKINRETRANTWTADTCREREKKFLFAEF